MFAFEVTSDDVRAVVGCDDETAEELFRVLELAAIEKAALYGSDMDEQTRYAYAEIKRQLKESGKIVR